MGIILICPDCVAVNSDDSNYCIRCGANIASQSTNKSNIVVKQQFDSNLEESFLIVTTPTIAGYKITKVLGLVTGLTPRTRGILGKFIASFESLVGGEVTTFTSEMEKARWEAIDRAKQKAKELGANAIISVDVETSDIGLQAGIVLFSATGTAVIIEPET